MRISATTLCFALSLIESSVPAKNEDAIFYPPPNEERDQIAKERDRAAIEHVKVENDLTQNLDQIYQTLGAGVSPAQPAPRHLTESCTAFAIFGSAGINSDTAFTNAGWTKTPINSIYSTNHMQYYSNPSPIDGSISKALPSGGDFVRVRWGQQNIGGVVKLYVGGSLVATQTGVNTDITTEVDYTATDLLMLTEKAASSVAYIYSVHLCSYDPSPAPTFFPTPEPTQEPTFEPTPKPTFEPTSKPSPVPTSLPTGKPSLPPSSSPTTVDTVTVVVSLSITVANAGDVSEVALRQALVAVLTPTGITDDSMIKSVDLAGLRRQRRLLEQERELPSSASSSAPSSVSSSAPPGSEVAAPPRSLVETAAVTFELAASLSALGYASAGGFKGSVVGSLESAQASGSFASAIETNCGCSGVVVGPGISANIAHAYPTLGPTAAPSPEPTPTPTLSPTVSCLAGYFYDGAVCQECSIGRYSKLNNDSKAPWPKNCTLCEAGKFSTATGASVCELCDLGKLSTPGRTFCRDCSAGEYNYNDQECKECEFGKYAPQAQTGSCITCPPGSATNNQTASTTCTPCDAGTFSLGSVETCTSCPPGKAAANGQSLCLECLKGSFSSLSGQATCASCSAGRVATGGGATGCVECGLGTHQPATGQTLCVSCATGKFADTSGALACQSCTAAYSSYAGSEACEVANSGYYLDPGSGLSEACPAKEATCEHGVTRAPVPRKGFWVDRSSYSFVADLYPCTRHTCSGANSSACWDQSWYAANKAGNSNRQQLGSGDGGASGGCGSGGGGANDSGDDDDSGASSLLCLEGSRGPLCGSCSQGYIFRSVSKLCGPCEDAKAVTFVVGGLALALVAALVATTLVVLPNMPSVRETEAFRLVGKFDSGSIKCIWVTYQIVMSTSWNLDIQYPSPFSELLGLLSIFSLDFLAIECFQSDGQTVENRYYTTVYLWSCLPILLGLIIAAAAGVRLFWLHFGSSAPALLIERLIAATNVVDNDGTTDREQTQEVSKQSSRIVNQHVWCGLLLSYLVLPPVANKQFQSLDCIPFQHDGSSYLRVDTAIDCHSQAYQTFQVATSLFIVLYNSIPLVWAVLLWRLRDHLDPNSYSSSSSPYSKARSLSSLSSMSFMNSTSTISSSSHHYHDPKLALHIRDQDSCLDSLRFLFNDYKTDKWWFEVVEMYRRVAFIGILPLCSPTTATRASLGCVLAIGSIAYYREEEPYRVKFTNFIAYIAQFVILITFYGALSIETGVMIDFGLKDTGMGLFLLLVNLSIAFFALWLGYSRYTRERRLRRLQYAKANTIEDASGFDETKFGTSFDALARTFVPSSHTLAFHYCTLPLAKMAAQSGLPCLENFGGVALTLRRPHELTPSDRKAFDRRAHNVKRGGGGGGEESGGGGGVCCPFEAVLVLALPSRMLGKLPGFESDPCLLVLDYKLLQAMRPTAFTHVLKPSPWLEGYVLLPPACLIRSYSLIKKELPAPLPPHSSPSREDVQQLHQPSMSFLSSTTSPLGINQKGEEGVRSLVEESRSISNKALAASSPPSPSMSSSPLPSSSVGPTDDWIRDGDSSSLAVSSQADVELQKPATALEYLSAMSKVRRTAEDLGLVPLYHFTKPSVAPLVLASGLRMSTVGQGDGGTYFSTLGPASLGLGKTSYEHAVVKECFGIHRVDEYTGYGSLDALIVYGIYPQALQRAPGGRANARMVPRTTFENFSLAHEDGNFFLRPDCILGAFLLPCDDPPEVNFVSKQKLEAEKGLDALIVQELLRAEDCMESNVVRITKAFETLNFKRGEALAAAGAGVAAGSEIEKAISFDEENGGGRSNPMLSTAAAAPATMNSLRRQSLAAMNSVANILRQATAASTTTTTTATRGTPNATGDNGTSLVGDASVGVGEAVRRDAAYTQDNNDHNGDDSEWEELHDESSRKSYYWNRKSGETSWETPTIFFKGKGKLQNNTGASASTEKGHVRSSVENGVELAPLSTAVSFSSL